MNGFSRRWYNPPNLFGGAPQRRIRRWLRKPPDLTRAGQPPFLGPGGAISPYEHASTIIGDELLAGRPVTPELMSEIARSYLGEEPSAAPSLTAAPAPVAPELGFEDYKAQPPSLRLAGVQPSEMSPYEIEEYANEMVAQRKAQKAQRMQELYEQSRAEGMVLPGETIQVGEPRMYTPEERGRRVGATDILRLKSGKATPEQVAEIRRERWRKAPELFPEEEQFIPPDLKAEVGRFAKMLPPDLQVGRARQKYAMKHPEAPTLPRYETTTMEKTPWGTITRKPITPPKLTTDRQMYQTPEGEYRQGLFDESGNLIKDLGKATEKDVKGTAAVSITLGKPASPTERKAIADKRAALDALDNLYDLYKKSFVGPITGRLAPTAGLIGRTSEQQENFMAATAAFKNTLIREITGAQLSEPEAKRIMKQIPDITDPSTRWMAKYEQTRKNVEYVHQRYLEILQQSGMRVPGGADITIEEPFSERPLEEMSDEELERIAGIR